ncbi:hypothetical protein HPB50_002337 [Hyalomma asiaticum]|uniref:Uncharacterized protein n=1 Tax=Hyalomma asiaticum TaxID=266040 RepID=A0ACB7S653_HYAAI|nr:hypothetical protein HPB50_002337 [Hyalomma asiaticum]
MATSSKTAQDGKQGKPAGHSSSAGSSSPEDKAAEVSPPKVLPVPGALVPVGAAPVVPARVLPARDYEDEQEFVGDIFAKRRKDAIQAAERRPSLTFIFGLAVVVITLAAVVTFYAIQPGGPHDEKPFPSTTTTNASLIVVEHLNATGTNITAAELVDA